MAWTLSPPTSPSGGASCVFLTQDEFVLRWGTKNVASFSNKDNTTTEINVAAVQQAFDFAVEEIHDGLLGSIYAIPLTFVTYDNILPQRIKSWCSVIAICFLYFNRGMDDKNKAGNKFTALLQQQYDEIGFVRAGIRQLSADVGSSAAATGIATPRRHRPWIYTCETGIVI